MACPQMLTIAQWINLPLLAVIKFSCLLSYWSIFKPNQKIRWALQASMTLLVCAYVGMFFASLFECWPLATNWEPAISRGHCLKPKGGVPYVSGTINVVSDIVVLVLPIPAIWSLKMDLRRKLRLVAIFSVGTLYVVHRLDDLQQTKFRSAVVASIVRLARTPVVFVDRDRTWNLGKIETWAYVSPVAATSSSNTLLKIPVSLKSTSALYAHAPLRFLRFWIATKFHVSQDSELALASFDLHCSSNLIAKVSTPSRPFKLGLVNPTIIICSNLMFIRTGLETAVMQCQTLRSAKHQKIDFNQRKKWISDLKWTCWPFRKRRIGMFEREERGLAMS